jgi:hypothetical protein
MGEQPPPDKKPDDQLTPRQTYNVISDTVTGANFRWKDNLFQALFILLGLILGVVIGLVVMSDNRIIGALTGGFVGLLAGLLVSGIFLLIYRGMRHARGQHD